MSYSQTTTALQPYYDLIADALNKRHADGDYEDDPQHHVPVFVSRMCESIARTCTERRGEPVSIEQVLKVEGLAAGHSDFHRKFALYCTELERGVANIRP